MKQKVHELITAALLQRFETASLAARQAHEAATNEESIAENKYDTFGLEASYLAHGQSQRVLDCEKDWLMFSHQAYVSYDKSGFVSLWHLVELAHLEQDSTVKYFFISPCAGGLTIEFKMQSIYLVTPSSPVGLMLIGKDIGDEVSLRQNGQETTYEIIAIH